MNCSVTYKNPSVKSFTESDRTANKSTFDSLTDLQDSVHWESGTIKSISRQLMYYDKGWLLKEINASPLLFGPLNSNTSGLSSIHAS